MSDEQTTQAEVERLREGLRAAVDELDAGYARREHASIVEGRFIRAIRALHGEDEP